MLTAKAILLYLLQSFSVINPTVDTSMIDFEEAYCLAQNIYYESRSEDIRGQYAVAHVTLNRVNDPRYPDTVCKVVKQKVRKTCAFSWYCESGDKDPVRSKEGFNQQISMDQFKVASMVAITVLAGKTDDNTNGATHFHNPHISQPVWRSALQKTFRIGNHDFYRFR